jgi:hypothetical protein
MRDQELNGRNPSALLRLITEAVVAGGFDVLEGDLKQTIDQETGQRGEVKIGFIGTGPIPDRETVARVEAVALAAGYVNHGNPINAPIPGHPDLTGIGILLTEDPTWTPPEDAEDPAESVQS